MQVAGEYELGVKKDKQRLEGRISALAERNDQLERHSRQQAIDSEALGTKAARLSSELERLQSAHEERMRALEAELVEARFDLHDRTAQLVDVLRAHHTAGQRASHILADASKAGSDENAGPGSAVKLFEPVAAAVAASFGGASLERALADLESGAKATAQYSRASLLAAAELGREATVQAILQPAKSVIANRLGAAANEDGSAAAGEPAMLRSASAGSDAGAGTLSKAGAGSGLISAMAAKTLGEALLRACRGGHTSVVRRLLASGATLSARSSDGLWQNALHVAAAAGRDGVVKALLGAKEVGTARPPPAPPAPTDGSPAPPPPAPAPLIHLDDGDSLKRTPLHLAAAGNFSEVVRLLLLNGAAPTAVDIHGLTPGDVSRGTRELAASAASGAAAAAAGSAGASTSRSSSSKGVASTASAAASARDFPFFRSGAMPVNGPCPAAHRMLGDASIIFWNASVRANRHYADRRFAEAIAAYSVALELVVSANMVRCSDAVAMTSAVRCRLLWQKGYYVPTSMAQRSDVILTEDQPLRRVDWRLLASMPCLSACSSSPLLLFLTMQFPPPSIPHNAMVPADGHAARPCDPTLQPRPRPVPARPALLRHRRLHGGAAARRLVPQRTGAAGGGAFALLGGSSCMVQQRSSCHRPADCAAASAPFSLPSI